MNDVERLVHGEHVRARHFQVVTYGQPRVPYALFVRLVQREVLVPVTVHDAAYDVHLVVFEVGKFVFAIRGEVDYSLFGGFCIFD